MNEQKWFQVSEEKDVVRVEFIPGEDRYWEPGVLADCPLPEFSRSRRVELSGQGAVWMYAHAAATAADCGAPSVTALSAAPAGRSDELGESYIRVVVDSNASQRGLVEISLVSPPPLSPAAIKRLIADTRCDLHAKKLREICITGQGSVEVYTALAFEAVRAGAQSLSCFAPRFGQLQVYSSTQCDDCPPAGALLPLNNWLQERLAIRLHGHVIGVAGDPNTGKSVFSTVLDYHRRQVGAAGWRLDCDAQAPTPPWYLQSRAGGLGVEADALRSTLKRDWTPQMEVLLADQLKNMRSSLPVSIADLPGGNHKADPPQRLPPGRERLFEPIDALIVLEASDRRTSEQWRMELANHGLSGRIRAVVTSTAPNSAPRLTGHTVDGVWQGVARGLDRGHSIRDLHQGFLPALDELWRVVSATS